MNKTTWVERYDRTFKGTVLWEAHKSFIASELQLQRREWIEMIEGMKFSEAEGWDYFFSDRGKCCPGDDYADVANKALDDIIKKVGK